MYKKLFCVLAIAIIAALTPIYSNAAGPLEGRVIILDPGHGQGTSPAFAGYIEHVRMLVLAEKMRDVLEARGATVLLTRENHIDIPLPVRSVMINKWSLEAIRNQRVTQLSSIPIFAHEQERVSALLSDIAQLDHSIAILDKILMNPEVYAPVYINTPFDTTRTRVIHPEWRRIFELQNDPLIRYNFMVVSLHSNATGTPIDTSINGADIFLSTNCNVLNTTYFADYSHADVSYIFADMLLDGIHNIGINRRTITPFHWMIIRETNVPAVLIENGFHTNATDRSRLQDNNFLARLAAVYADTFEQYFAAITPAYIESVRPIFTPGQRIYLERTMQLFASTDTATSICTVSPQAVWVVGTYGQNWVQIATWLGDKWINFSY